MRSVCGKPLKWILSGNRRTNRYDKEAQIDLDRLQKKNEIRRQTRRYKTQIRLKKIVAEMWKNSQSDMISKYLFKVIDISALARYGM